MCRGGFAIRTSYTHKRHFSRRMSIKLAGQVGQSQARVRHENSRRGGRQIRKRRFVIGDNGRGAALQRLRDKLVAIMRLAAHRDKAGAWRDLT
jgi:hypothetical protein